MLVTVVLTIQILAALTMAGLILVQHGKGADMGAAFGSGSAGSLFGASGSANFLSRMTSLAATVFFVSTLLLAYFGAKGLQQAPTDTGNSVFDNAPIIAPVETGPAAAIPGADTSTLVPATSNTDSSAASIPAADANASAGADTQSSAVVTNESAANAESNAAPASPEAAASAPAAGENSATSENNAN